MTKYLDAWPLGPPSNDIMPHPSGRGECRRRVIIERDWHDAPRRSGPHRAQDIFAPRGTEVRAPIAGFVATSTWGANGGWQVSIRGRRSQVLLSHLAVQPLVFEGDTVDVGQVVGVVGNTGSARTTCPHLHIQGRAIPGRAIVNLYPDLMELAPGAELQLDTTDPSPRVLAFERGNGNGKLLLGLGFGAGIVAIALTQTPKRRRAYG